MTTFYKANFDDKDIIGGEIVALTSKDKRYIKKRLLAFGVKATKIYNVVEQFPKEKTAHHPITA